MIAREALVSHLRKFHSVAPPALAFVTYANTLLNRFVWDDHYQVLKNPWIRDLSHLDEIFGHDVWAFTNHPSSYYRPLMHVAYMLTYGVADLSPAAFHLVNVLLHVVTTVLVFRLIRRVVSDPTGWAACIGALVFAVHPIHVEAVAWVGSLADLASAAFQLLGVLLFVATSEVGKRTRLLNAIGAMAFLASMLFKEPGVALLAIIVTLDLARRPTGRGTRYWLERYGAIGGAAGVYVALRLHALGGALPHASETQFGIWQALSVAGTAIWRYLAMLLVPYPLNAFQTMDSAIALPPLIGLTALPVLIATAVWRGSVPITAAFAVFFFPLVPALSAPALLPGLDNPWAERYVYCPSAGLAILVAIAVAAILRSESRWRAVCVAGGAVPLVVLSAWAAIDRNRVWHDDMSLWTDTVAKSPGAGAAHASLGYALFVRGDVDGAIREYNISISRKPDYADAHLNLGVALAMKGLHEAAVPSYREALRLQPWNAVAHADLAISLSTIGLQEPAFAEARRAIELDQRLPRGFHALGMALGNAGNVGGAATAFRRAVELDPTDMVSQANLERAERMLRAP
jgi:protein O-mannosyl-transferase